MPRTWHEISGAVTVKKISFTVSKSDEVGLSGFTVREQDGRDIHSAVTVSSACSSNSGSGCLVGFTFDDEREIGEGVTRTFDLRANVTDAGSGDSVSTNFMTDDAFDVGALDDDGATIEGHPDAFIWSDESEAPHDESDGGSEDFISGFLVPGLAKDPQVLSK